MNGTKAIYLGTYKFNGSLNTTDLLELTDSIAKILNFEALEWSCEHYPGGGISFTRYLAESHIEIDTYPESNIVEIMVVSCKAGNHFSEIIKYLSMENFTCVSENVLSRNEGPWLLT